MCALSQPVPFLLILYYQIGPYQETHSVTHLIMMYWECSAFWDPIWAPWSPAFMRHRAKWSTQKVQEKCTESVWPRFCCVAQKNGSGLDSTMVVTTLSRGSQSWMEGHCVGGGVTVLSGGSSYGEEPHRVECSVSLLIRMESLWCLVGHCVEQIDIPVLSHQIEWRVTTVSRRSQRWVSAQSPLPGVGWLKQPLAVS